MRQLDPLRQEQWEDIEHQLHSELDDAREGYERAKLQFDEARDLANSQGLAHPENNPRPQQRRKGLWSRSDGVQ